MVVTYTHRSRMVNQKSDESEKKCSRQATVQQATCGAIMRTPMKYTTHNNSVEMEPLITRCRHSTVTDDRLNTLHNHTDEPKDCCTP